MGAAAAAGLSKMSVPGEARARAEGGDQGGRQEEAAHQEAAQRLHALHEGDAAQGEVL